MSKGKNYALGDSVTIVNDRYLLNGTYRIMQITKGKFKCEMQLDKARKSAAATVDELKSWEHKGIYTPGSEAWSCNLQGFVGLFHLNEGQGTTAKNNAPIDAPINGSIVACSWEDGPITFNGSNSWVNCGDDSKSGINLQGKCSFVAWFSPSANDSTKRNVCHKDAQFALYYKVSTGVLSCDLVIGGQVKTFNSDAGLVKVGGRIFALVTYDGSNVKMYYNGYTNHGLKPAPLTLTLAIR